MKNPFKKISIAIISNLVILPPSMLLINLFRRSRRRITKSAKLKLAIKLSKRIESFPIK